MSSPRLSRALAASVLACVLAACGERAGDPIVRVAADEAAAGAPGGGPGEPGAPAGRGGTVNGGGSTNGGSNSGGSVSPGGSASGGGAGSSTSGGTPLGTGPVGLCGACGASDECGDANDACIRHDEERFCGRDCFDARDCPEGYACVELTNSQLYQCVPETSCPEPAVTPPTLDELRFYLLERINAVREAYDHEPLSPSLCLDQLAQESALSYAATDEPLGKFVKECDPIWPSCACGWTAEAEVSIARYGLEWRDAADHALGLNRDTENDRFVHAYRDYDATDVGIGFWISGDEAWIALSFR